MSGELQPNSNEAIAISTGQLNRRVEYLEQFLAQSQLPLDALVFIRDILLPVFKTPLDSPEATVEDIYAKTDLADYALQETGIHIFEAQEREGSAPRITVTAEELKRWYRAGTQSEYFNSLPVATSQLPGTLGQVQLKLSYQSGASALEADFSPSKINHKITSDVARTLKMQGSHDQISVKFFESLGKELQGADTGQNRAIGNDYYYRQGSRLMKSLQQSLERAELEMRLGKISMSTALGYKDMQAVCVAKAMEDAQQTFARDGSGWKTTLLSERAQMEAVGLDLTSPDGKHKYTFYLSRSVQNEGHHTLDKLKLVKNEGKTGAGNTFDEFKQAILTDLEAVQKISDWLYKYAEVKADQYHIPLNLPDETIAQSLLNSGIVERLDPNIFHHSFDTLGGHKQLIDELKVLGRAVINHMQDKAPQPGHATITGKSGAGKTAMAGALLEMIAREGIPVYMVKASSEAGNYFAQDPAILIRLFLLATINGGVIYIPDLDTTLGTDKTTRDTVESQLNRLLETTANLPRVWVLADTAKPEAVRDSLIQAHRLGRHLFEVGIETDPKSTAEILKSIFINYSAKFNPNENPDDTLNKWQIDWHQVGQKIVEAGNIVPGRLAAIAEKILMHKQIPTTSNLISEINKAKAWEENLEFNRAGYLEFGWRETLEETKRAMETRLDRSEKENAELKLAIARLEERITALGINLERKFGEELWQLELRLQESQQKEAKEEK